VSLFRILLLSFFKMRILATSLALKTRRTRPSIHNVNSFVSTSKTLPNYFSSPTEDLNLLGPNSPLKSLLRLPLHNAFSVPGQFVRLRLHVEIRRHPLEMVTLF